MESRSMPPVVTQIKNVGANIVFVLLVAAAVYGIYLFCIGLSEWKAAHWNAKYADCVARGGTVTEGGIAGPQCVGVKTRGTW